MTATFSGFGKGTWNPVKLPHPIPVGTDMCECYQVGGPWISEDPDCPTHGDEARSRATKAANLEDEVERLEAEVARLTRRLEALERAVFGKTA